MKTFSQYQKLLVGVGALTGAAVYYFNGADKRQAFSSWTTNYTLSSSYAKWDENWDHRSPSSLEHPNKLKVDKNNNKTKEIELRKPKATRHLILIRHGQYELTGTTDEQRILTKLGRTQAQYTGKRLRELGLPYTTMIRSTMARAQETANIIAESLPEVPARDCNLIREGAPIPPEPPVGHWKPEVHFYQDGPRIEAGFRQYFHRADADQQKDSYLVLVCHANVIRYFVCRALQFPPEAWLRLSLNHASITWLSITPSGRVILRTLGDSGHIPADAITSQ